MSRPIPDGVIEHIKRWEGLRLKAYPDPGSIDGNPFTVGYGHTSDSFLKVQKGLVITAEQAEAALRHDLGEADDTLARLVKVPLTDNQRGALLSFIFNIGESQFAKSTLLRKLNAGDYNAVPSELMRWTKNDGKVMQGLVNRRAAEAGLWAKGEFVTSRGVDAKPAAPSIDRESVSWGAGILSSLAALFVGTGPAQWALAAVIVVAFGVGLWLFLSKRLAPK